MKKRGIRNIVPDYGFSNIIDIGGGFFEGSDLVIFDIDNTLVFSEKTDTKKEIKKWFKKISQSHKCICVSNSRTIFKRKEEICAGLNCEIFLSKNKKPFKKLFEELKKKYNFRSDKVFVVGDRIFTDILFGNLNGAKTVLVNPVSNRENILIKVVRKIENIILKKYV